MSRTLFDDNSDDEGNIDNVLTINKDYAENYGKWREKEDYQKQKARFGVKDFDSDSSDSEESGDENYFEPDNPSFDKDFFRVLAAVRTNHPILEKKEKFFKESYGSKVKGKEKPLSIVDYERKRLLEKGGKYEDEDSVKPGTSRNSRVVENVGFLNSKEKFKFDDNLSDDDDGDDLFVKKDNDDNSEESEEEDENEAVDFLKGKRKELTDKVDEELLGALKKDWETNMSKEDKFLMDYFVNKRYLEEEDETKERSDNHYVLDFEPLEDDEETYNKMEEYESKYRFRFEEPDQTFTRRYPRVVEDTVRKKDTKRKEEREKKKNMQKEREESKKQELLRFKAMKKQEIMNRIEEIKETAGIEKSGFDPSNFDLQADFDPEKHDALMSQMFNDEYYNEEGETEKPKFEDEELQRELEEEYEKLKELDTMAEGTFKYAEVVPNSYGLATEEILFAKDAELNRWCSINRVLKYGQGENEEKKIKTNFQKRGQNDHVKYKIIPSLYSDNIEENWEAEEEKRRKRNLKKKERKRKKLQKLQKEEIVSHPNESASDNLDSSSVQNGADTESSELENSSKEKTVKVKKDKGKNKKSKNKSVNNNSEVVNPAENKNKKIKAGNDNNNLAKKPKPSKENSKNKAVNNGSEVINSTERKTKKRKRGNDNNDEDAKNKFNKKSKLSKEKLKKSNQLEGISDARLLAYGQNPKKIKKSLKYSSKFND